MKKTFLIVLGFSLISGAVSAQFNVNSQGRAIFGKINNTNNGIAIVDESTTTTPTSFVITRKSNNDISFVRAVPGVSTVNTFIGRFGEVAIGKGWASNFTPLQNIPLQINAFDSGASGIRISMPSNTFSTEGVSVRFVESSTVPYAAYSGNSRVFYVNSDGRVFSNGVQLTSDISLKQNIKPIANSLEKLMQLRGVTYDMNFPNNAREKTTISLDEEFRYAQQLTPSLTREVFNQIQAEKARQRMGVIAQEVEKIVPEVVSTREDGLKAVGYSEMIGLLIEAMKEQQTIIDGMKLELSSLKGNQLRSAEATGLVSDLIAACALAQNTPNPFTEQTEIKYYVASGAKTAFICIFDMQGKLLQKLDAQIGQNSLFIEGSKLEAGMYLYSLIVDGQEVDTKRMILTK